MLRVPRLPRLFLVVLGVLVLALSPLHATWSIVLVDTSTGEIAVGTATCIPNDDLADFVPLIRVDRGGAASQAFVSGTAANRKIIWRELRKGTLPQDIITIIQNTDPNVESRQFGIVDTLGRTATFTGSSNSPWAGGLTGTFGTFAYAIQGNLLTGAPVVNDAEQAILNTPGDVAEKLMVAMEAAAAQGGDARCTSVGKSSHVGVMFVSRYGDIDGNCNGDDGCANGTYYMDLEAPQKGVNDPDPVLQLRGLFDAWRLSLNGRPDHFLSTKVLADPVLPGNGTATTTLTLDLNDWAGFPITTGGATVTVTHRSDSAGLSSIGTVVDHGDGSYTIPITTGVDQGRDRFSVIVDDGIGPVELSPIPTLRHANTLNVDVASLSAATGGTANFTLSGPEDAVGKGYFLLASASGTSPGLPIGSIVLPLNLDPVTLSSISLKNGAIFTNTLGVLAPDGTGSAQFNVGANLLTPLIGGTLSFAYMTVNPIDFPSNAVNVSITP